MREQEPGDEGISLEEGVALREQSVQVVQIESLKVAAYVQHHVVRSVGAQGCDLIAGAEVVVDPVRLPRPGVSRVVEDEGSEASRERRVEPCERPCERTFPHA